MADVPELIDRGIKAYVAGRVGEALRTFQEVLELDPGNPKARSYLVLIHGGAPGLTPFPGAMKAVALPPPAPARPAVVGATPEPGEEFAPSPWDEGPAAAATFVLESGGGLDLDAVAEKSDLRTLVPEGARAPTPRSAPEKNDVHVWMEAAKELFALGDFSGSLELIEKVLQVDADHGEARDYLRQNEATLIAMYESKLGTLGRVPRLGIGAQYVWTDNTWIELQEALFALPGLPRLDTARILANLIADGVIKCA